ncbi:UDP-N-acetylglucosamine 2-epimerase (non-hydrolyzing) [Candidatus Microgenomates bacterium]|nr:UDP-N-acetylglucosamine 2-epimerase (non-hydrolyzing) [Candidatus Microgenomates bacterium]
MTTSKNMHILLIAGTRPNFIKISPLIKEFNKHKNISYTLIHTGQHYDLQLSDIFFKQLNIPQPNIKLNTQGETRDIYIQKLKEDIKENISKQKYDLTIVVGDVNSTLAGALASKELNIPVAHIESGLRSFDMDMPEELNRIQTDKISSFLFTTEPQAKQNLLKEGIDIKKIVPVGNIMIDSLLNNIQNIDNSNILKELNIKPKQYILSTIHRQSNTDNKEALKQILTTLIQISEKHTVVLPLHPRTEKALENFNLKELIQNKNIIITKPLGYFEFLKLIKETICVISDSGGVQEETTILNIPCLTMRENTERPITTEKGTSILVDNDYKAIPKYIDQIDSNKWKHAVTIPLWDGKTAERITQYIQTL